MTVESCGKNGAGDNGAAGARRAPGELESGVLAALWASPVPLTATQVNGALPGGLAPTTVLTILARLYEKGLVTRERAGRGYAYSPAHDEATHTADRMRTLLERGRDREAVLARFLSDLSDEDEALMRRLLRPRGAGGMARGGDAERDAS